MFRESDTTISSGRDATSFPGVFPFGGDQKGKALGTRLGEMIHMIHMRDIDLCEFHRIDLVLLSNSCLTRRQLSPGGLFVRTRNLRYDVVVSLPYSCVLPIPLGRTDL